MRVLNNLHVINFRREVLFQRRVFGELFFGDDFHGKRQVVILDAVGQKDSAETATTDFLDQLEFMLFEEVTKLVLRQAVDHELGVVGFLRKELADGYLMDCLFSENLIFSDGLYISSEKTTIQLWIYIIFFCKTLSI